jgi:hypothetical protein
VDRLKVDDIKSPQIGPSVHHTDEKLKIKEETNRQTERIWHYTQRRNVQKNKLIKKSQWICLLPARIAAGQMQTSLYIYSLTPRFGFNNVRILRDIRLGQSHRRWNADSSSIPQAMLIGSSIIPILCRCMFNGQCPVMSPTKILNLALGSHSTYLVKPGFGFFSHILDWRQAVSKLHEAQCDLSNYSRSLRLSLEDVNGRQGSGTTQLKIFMWNNCFHSWQLCVLLF